MCINRRKIKLWNIHLVGFYRTVLSNLGLRTSACINLKTKHHETKVLQKDKKFEAIQNCLIDCLWENTHTYIQQQLT